MKPGEARRPLAALPGARLCDRRGDQPRRSPSRRRTSRAPRLATRGPGGDPARLVNSSSSVSLLRPARGFFFLSPLILSEVESVQLDLVLPVGDDLGGNAHDLG